MQTTRYWNHCRKVVAIGRNYVDHIKELGNQRPSKPFFFLKPPSTILSPLETAKDAPYQLSGPVLVPQGINCHYEVELALIVGKTLSNFRYIRKQSPESAEKYWMDKIEGYAIGIDLTARNLQDQVKKAGLPWSAAKGYDTFLPMSKFIPKEKIPDPHHVRLQLTVNDKVVQDDNTELMLFKIPELLEAITDVMTLEEGDIILTGTPKGVGQVVDGDVMKASCFVGDQCIDSFEVKVQDRKDPDGNSW